MLRIGFFAPFVVVHCPSDFGQGFVAGVVGVGRAEPPAGGDQPEFQRSHAAAWEGEDPLVADGNAGSDLSAGVVNDLETVDHLPVG